jgi:hypothetical protein
VLTLKRATVDQRTSQSVKNVVQHARVSNRRDSIACELMDSLIKRIIANHMPSLHTGFSNIFSTRIGERSVIQGDPENHHRIEMKPDRIYGLRTTDAIDKILKQPHVSHLGETSELEDGLLGRLTISCNPDSGGLASIYPFLVMEAKSLKGGSNFPDIENQTAVPIRNLLYLQLKLQEDEFNKMKIPGGPLAWFFAYIGERWRVYGCYVTKAEPDALPYYVS